MILFEIVSDRVEGTHWYGLALGLKSVKKLLCRPPVNVECTINGLMTSRSQFPWKIMDNTKKMESSKCMEML